MQWYYSTDGQRQGPVTHTELERLIQAGTVTDEALLWRQGMGQWKTLREISSVNPALFAGVPPPLPGRMRETVGDTSGTSASDHAEESATHARRPMRLEREEERPAPPEVLFYAGFWRRAGAFVLDGLLWMFIWNILSSVAAAFLFPEAKAINEAILAAGGPFKYQPSAEDAVVLFKTAALGMVIGVVWAVVYEVMFLRRYGATPGKLAFGLRVVKANNKPLSVPRILARALMRIISGMPTLFIGFLIAAFDDQKRSLHDYVCGTRVVKKRKE